MNSTTRIPPSTTATITTTHHVQALLTTMLDSYTDLDQYMREAYREEKYRLCILNDIAIRKMDAYAIAVQEYLLAHGIHSTYRKGWSTNHRDVSNRIVSIYHTGNWRTDNYFLEISLLEEGVTDVWVGLNSKHYVWTASTSSDGITAYTMSNDSEPVLTTKLLQAVQDTITSVYTRHQCSTCYYGNSTGQYCGKGLELTTDCTSFKSRDNQ